MGLGAGSCGGGSEADEEGHVPDALRLHAAGLRLLLPCTAGPQGHGRSATSPAHHLETAAPLDGQAGVLLLLVPPFTPPNLTMVWAASALLIVTSVGLASGAPPRGAADDVLMT